MEEKDGREESVWSKIFYSDFIGDRYLIVL